MDILIISQYLRDIRDFEKNNSRFVYLARMLSNTAVVELVTSDFIHSEKKHCQNVGEFQNVKVTALHEPGYRKNVSLKRFYSHKRLSARIRKYLNARNKPDVIYCAVPSLDCAYEAARYAKKNGIRFIVDIQDLWPEAFKMFFRAPFISDAIFYPMERKADYIYASADEIIGVSDMYCERAKRVNNKVDGYHTVFLGTTANFYQKKAEKPKRVGDMFSLVYIGTLGYSYDLKCVFRAMIELEHRGYSNLECLIFGDGPLEDEFRRFTQVHNLDVKFYGRLPYDEMCERLMMCDIALNPIRKGSAGSVINKVGDYAMAGLPVINTQECKEYRDLLDEYGCGINCLCESHVEMANAIETLITDDNLRITMAKSSLTLGRSMFDRDVSYQTIVERIMCEEKEYENTSFDCNNESIVT